MPPQGRSYWTNPQIDFLINHYIREYDIRKAGISAYLQAGIIDQATFDYLASLPDESRQIKTGLMIKEDPNNEATRKNCITQARAQFMQMNNIHDHDIVSIKNDAIYVIDKECKYLDFDKMHFRPKSLYTSYYRFGRLEMYYYFDKVHDIEDLDVKGISAKSKMGLHEKYMADFIKCLFMTAQENVKETIPLIQSFEASYVRHELPIYYYREFNARSEYKIADPFYTQYYAAHLPETTDINNLDISYNLNLLRHFYKIYSSIIL